MHWSSFMIIGFGNNFKERTMSKTGIDILQGRSKLFLAWKNFGDKTEAHLSCQTSVMETFVKMFNK